MEKTLSDYQKSIEASLGEISKITFQAELLGAQEARVLLEQRTFATGATGVKDINGKVLSKYSEDYARRRKKAGLQTANKDLIFSKDSSSIKDNIDLGTSDGKPAVGYLNEKGYRIATYQEEREKTKIFEINDAERNAIKDTVKDFLMTAIREMAKKWQQ